MNYKDNIIKLQLGINRTGVVTVLYNCNQFYSKEKRRPINMYSIKLVTWDEEKSKNVYTEVFKSAQQILVVLFLRNLYFTIVGREVPKTEFPKFEKQWKEFKQDILNEE